MGNNDVYDYTDKSDLYRAWENYYNRIGLGYNKRLKMVFRRVRIGKFPK
jgi:hypothetical protein